MKILSYQANGYLNSFISPNEAYEYAKNYLGMYIKFLPNFCSNFSQVQQKALKIFSRKEMPVLDNRRIDLLKEFLENIGIPYTQEKVKCSSFKSIQKDLYLDKALSNILDIAFKKQNFSILICDKNGYLLDGNHRWFAYMLLNPEKKVKTLRIEFDYNTLIPLLTRYSQVVLEEELRE